MRKSNDACYATTGAGVVVSISVISDDSPSSSYMGKQGANGMRQLTDR